MLRKKFASALRAPLRALRRRHHIWLKCQICGWLFRGPMSMLGSAECERCALQREVAEAKP